MLVVLVKLYPMILKRKKLAKCLKAISDLYSTTGLPIS